MSANCNVCGKQDDRGNMRVNYVSYGATYTCRACEAKAFCNFTQCPRFTECSHKKLAGHVSVIYVDGVAYYGCNDVTRLRADVGVVAGIERTKCSTKGCTGYGTTQVVKNHVKVKLCVDCLKGLTPCANVFMRMGGRCHSWGSDLSEWSYLPGKGYLCPDCVAELRNPVKFFSRAGYHCLSAYNRTAVQWTIDGATTSQAEQTRVSPHKITHVFCRTHHTVGEFISRYASAEFTAWIDAQLTGADDDTCVHLGELLCRKLDSAPGRTAVPQA
jgi:hypothetical protein